ncbi:DUF4279 domain-containing protein [Paenibacillus oralis]|uniref:DUF4279 domain-containing protein n=1 Tax=Paenibacillus oralis TaxID=2490856 RepID=UPI0015A7B8C0|nr:DUF4279 domain-containing protein [Paenibacillus oralis]
MEETSIMVAFSVMGLFNPNELTKSLLVTPTGYFRKGEKLNGTHFRKEDGWFLRTKLTASLDINNQLSELLSVLKSKKSELCKFKENNDVSYQFNTAIYIEQKQTPAIYLEADIINFANTIGAEFDFDLYVN